MYVTCKRSYKDIVSFHMIFFQIKYDLSYMYKHPSASHCIQRAVNNAESNYPLTIISFTSTGNGLNLILLITCILRPLYLAGFLSKILNMFRQPFKMTLCSRIHSLSYPSTTVVTMVTSGIRYTERLGYTRLDITCLR